MKPVPVCCAFPLPCRPSKATMGGLRPWWMMATERKELSKGKSYRQSLGDSGVMGTSTTKGGKTQLDLGKNEGEGDVRRESRLSQHRASV